MTPVRFEGDPPFHLPLTQRASAIAVDEIVEMTLYVVVLGQGPEPVPILTSMTHGAAQALGGQLRTAAVQAELAAAKARRS